MGFIEDKSGEKWAVEVTAKPSVIAIIEFNVFKLTRTTKTLKERIGFANFLINDENKTIAELKPIEVYPAYQCHGIGSSLYQYAESWIIKEYGVKKIIGDVSTQDKKQLEISKNFYTKLGFSWITDQEKEAQVHIEKSLEI